VVTFVAAAANPSPPKALGVALGVVIVLAGAALISTAPRLTRAFNALYRELPGKIRYPTWFIPAIGWFFVVFGIVVAALTLLLAK